MFGDDFRVICLIFLFFHNIPPTRPWGAHVGSQVPKELPAGSRPGPSQLPWTWPRTAASRPGADKVPTGGGRLRSGSPLPRSGDFPLAGVPLHPVRSLTPSRVQEGPMGEEPGGHGPRLLPRLEETRPGRGGGELSGVWRASWTGLGAACKVTWLGPGT